MLWLTENIDSIVADLFPQRWTESEIKLHESQVEKFRAVWLHQPKGRSEQAPDEGRTERLLRAEIQHWRTNGDHDRERECQARLDAYLLSSASGFPHPGEVPPRPPCKVLDVKWEFPIRNGQYVIGFIDLCVIVNKAELWLDGVDGATIAPCWKVGFDHTNLFFEVKPSIRSLGELMRQINLYRAYEHSQFFVVSPDDRFRPQLETQGIRFVKYVE